MDAGELTARPNLEQYKKQAKEIVKAWKGDGEALQKILALYNVKRKVSLAEFREQIRQRIYHLARKKIEDDNFSLSDAQFLLAREYAFDSWPKFAAHIQAMNDANS